MGANTIFLQKLGKFAFICASSVALHGCSEEPASEQAQKSASKTATIPKDKFSAWAKPATGGIEHVVFFDTFYYAKTESVTSFLDAAEKKLDEAKNSHDEILAHLKKRDLDGFLTEYRKEDRLLAGLEMIDSTQYADFLATALLDETLRKPPTTWEETIKPWENSINYLVYLRTIQAQRRVHLAYSEIFAHLARNHYSKEAYQGLEECCDDPDARLSAGMLKTFLKNYVPAQAKDESNGKTTNYEKEGNDTLSLVVVFDDQKLASIKEGKETLCDQDCQFAEVSYYPDTDALNLCVYGRRKKAGHGRTFVSEEKFQVLDFDGDGILKGIDGRVNGIEPERILEVNKDYKVHLQRIVDILKTRYQGKYFD